ncbi:hypothetical protein ACFVZW_19310 [Streptomyces sp. NPDC059567]|uniref:hypothetical protein n=1 Tax=Streptomyces sp. NPDC059567 TaxID=3346867 RepID=UPI0036BB6C27
MTIAPRPRFSVRAGLTEASGHDGPFEGMPDHLMAPLQEWVVRVLRSSLSFVGQERLARDICVRVRLVSLQDEHGAPLYVAALARAVGAQLLDVVDQILLAEVPKWEGLQELSRTLDDGGSAYRINDARNGLEERVTPAVRDAVRQTIAEAAGQPTAGSAADHLAAAWQAAYGRGPEPVRAYSESIKAVEAAAHAVVQPNHAKATLGTMLGELKSARHKFVFAIPAAAGDAVAPAEALMRALWDGQTSRHGGQTATVDETLEAARAGVHLAATLVQWFTSGAVTRIP